MLRRITTQLHHTHNFQHLLPPSHHHLPSKQQHLSPSFTKAAPFRGLFSIVFGSKQTKQASAMVSFALCVPAPALLNTREFGGYAGTRVGEAQNPQPPTHARDWTATEQPNASHMRINEAGDSVRTCVSRTPHVAPAALPAPPPPTIGNARRPLLPKQKPWEYLRCAQCGPVAAAQLASADGGLM